MESGQFWVLSAVCVRRMVWIVPWANFSIGTAERAGATSLTHPSEGYTNVQFFENVPDAIAE